MPRAVKQKTKKKIQWLAIISAVVVAVQQLADKGLVAPDVAIIVLMVTNLISAVLPEIHKKLGSGE